MPSQIQQTEYDLTSSCHWTLAVQSVMDMASCIKILHKSSDFCLSLLENFTMLLTFIIYNTYMLQELSLSNITDITININVQILLQI